MAPYNTVLYNRALMYPKRIEGTMKRHINHPPWCSGSEWRSFQEAGVFRGALTRRA